MKAVIDFFTAIAATTKTTEKKAILATAGPECKALLLAALNPESNYYVSAKTINAVGGQAEVVDQTCLQAFHQLCQTLSQRLVTGHRAVKYVENFFLSNCDPATAALLAKILFREPLGCDAKLVNSVHPDLIPEFRLMLAPNKVPDLDADVRYPVVVQAKLDGVRCIVRVPESDQEMEIVTRNGKKIRNPKLLAALKTEPGLRPGMVLDGEIYVHGWKFSDIFSAASTESGEDVDAGDQLQIHVWDQMTSEEWDAKSCDRPYLKRISGLFEVFQGSERIVVVPSVVASNREEVKEEYRRLLETGYEGAMLKDPNGLYVWKRATLRSGEVAKLKVFQTEDLEIIGSMEGEGKNVGRLGKLVVRYKGNEVGVGSGFTDDQRLQLWRDRASLVGRLAEVKFFEETVTNGQASLRFPVFVRFRDDK